MIALISWTYIDQFEYVGGWRWEPMSFRKIERVLNEKLPNCSRVEIVCDPELADTSQTDPSEADS